MHITIIILFSEMKKFTTLYPKTTYARQERERQKNYCIEKGKNLNFEKVIRMPQKDVLSD